MNLKINNKIIVNASIDIMKIIILKYLKNITRLKREIPRYEFMNMDIIIDLTNNII